MVLPAQFQLGLELTNIVNPLSQAVSALGSLALVDAVKKSGSDVITEMKLASLIGRHRIDPVIKFHFREMVAKADQNVFSRYLDIVLESGAGPTVQEAMKNPALFSMVIQLSALTFAHEDESLANAIVEAIERIVRDSGREVEIVPDYVSLLGTLRSCQQQTAAFRWAILFESVEHKIGDAYVVSKARDTTEPTLKKRKINKATNANHQSIEERCLPFPALQSLLMWLQSLQSFPEHRLLYLRCHSGISTAVVWCHHILGLTVNVRLEDTEICFGDGHTNVLIEASESQRAVASLMDAADRNEPLFTLAHDENNPSIPMESRAEAYGYGLKALKRAGLSDHDIKRCSHGILAIGLLRCFPHMLPNFKALRELRRKRGSHEKALFDTCMPSQERVKRAGQFFFALKEVNPVILEEFINFPARSEHIMKKLNWQSLAAILTSFAMINPEDLEQCTSLPLCLYEQHPIPKTDHGIVQSTISDATYFHTLNVVNAFGILSRLLLGHMYSDDYVKSAMLVSAWGWSIFFQSIDAVDPADVSFHTIRVARGVPSRRGLRRTRIIDGPTESRFSSFQGERLSEFPQVTYFPGVSTAEKVLVLVGHHSDAFQVTQIFNWRSCNIDKRAYKLGYRQMQDMCIKTARLPPCQHEASPTDFKSWIDSKSCYPRCLTTEELRVISKKEIPFVTLWPKEDGDLESCERTFKRPGHLTDHDTSTRNEYRSVPISMSNWTVWFFYVSESPAARWLQLDDLCNSCEEGAFNIGIRGRETCLKCAIYTDPFASPGSTSILL